jgi:hypothetical protein
MSDQTNFFNPNSAAEKEKVQSQLEVKTSKAYSSEKICDFYNKTRKYVPDIFKEWLCPQPTDETLFLARKIKNERTGKANLKRKEKLLLQLKNWCSFCKKSYK